MINEARHTTVGREVRPLCTEDPNKRMPLPVDSEAWDRGVSLFPRDPTMIDDF